MAGDPMTRDAVSDRRRSRGSRVLAAMVLAIVVLIGGYWLLARDTSSRVRQNEVATAAGTVESAAERTGPAR